MFFLAAVKGVSMVPYLAPGDRLVIRRVRRPSGKLIGRIVVAVDPRDGTTLVIKRFASYDGDSFVLLGDNSAASTDSRTIGRFPSASLLGKAVYRYYPLSTAGLLA